ncbi:MAG: DUF1566 domain-containing protein [Candidatus Electrothrix sp. AW3_4]|nr:DUF1566 domain-containing protein [Candidatus Electrothrix gigas]
MQKKLLYHKKKQRKIIRRVAVPLAAVFCCGIGSADALTDPPSPPSPCGAGRPLPANTWLMTAPSCEPNPADLASQYSDDLNGPHNTGWLSFTWDSAPTAQNYVKQAGSDSLVLGTGNWLYSYKAGTLLLDGTATPTVPCSDYGSGLMGRCFAVDLTPSSGRNLWQIVGHPFSYPVSWDDVRVASSDGTTWTQYTPSEAATANLMAKEYWFWNGSSYQTKDDSTPGAIGVLQPQESIWVRIKADSSSLSAGDFKLLIPAAHEPNTVQVQALNDTGITWSGNYASGNNTTCIASTTPDGDNVVTAQDCSHGRDAIHNDDSDGHAGFSYTKLDSNGEPLPDQTVDYATTPWACVKDNVTGLIWEVKTDDDGLHDKDDRYNWYNTDPATNGGAVGYDDDDRDICYGYNSSDLSTFCNTEAYVNRVNAASLCGANNWRMPTLKELESLVNYGRSNSTIDSSYFSNAVSSNVWSGTPHAEDSERAWFVYFSNGYSGADARNNNLAIRLVRNGK